MWCTAKKKVVVEVDKILLRAKDKAILVYNIKITNLHTIIASIVSSILKLFPEISRQVTNKVKNVWDPE